MKQKTWQTIIGDKYDLHGKISGRKDCRLLVNLLNPYIHHWRKVCYNNFVRCLLFLCYQFSHKSELHNRRQFQPVSEYGLTYCHAFNVNLLIQTVLIKILFITFIFIRAFTILRGRPGLCPLSRSSKMMREKKSNGTKKSLWRNFVKKFWNNVIQVHVAEWLRWYT